MEKTLTHVALFAALIAVLGLIPRVELVGGVPITAQSLGVMLCGTVLGARRGALAVLLFIVLVAAGLPLLSGGRGGLGVFAGPTAGYLLGWVAAAFVAGLIVETWRGPLGLVAFVGALIGGIPVLYAFGIPGTVLTAGVTFPEAAAGTVAFLPGDLIKAAIAGMLTQAIARMRPGAVLSRA